jgi:vitamin B12 transporter
MFTKTTLSLVACATLVASLGANTLTIDPIVISATKTEQSLKETTANVNIITAQEIEEKHYTTVTEALNSLSGISFTSNGGLGTTTSVYVRGFDSKRVLVLIDGIRYNDPTGLSGAPFEHLMITDIERIEVVKGAQSGVWGADASAGVINIITKSAQKGLHGTLTGEYGSFNTKKYGINASYATDNYYFKASSAVVDTDGFSAQAPKGVNLDTLEDDGYKNTTTSFKAGYSINETNKIDFVHTIIDAKSNYDGCDKLYPATCTATEKANSTAFKSSTNDTFSSLNFNHIDSFNEVNFYAKRSTFEREYTENSHYDGNVNEYGLTSKIPYQQSDFVVLGADYKRFEHLNSINKNYTNKGFFATNSNTFNDTTTLTESIRADAYDAFNDKTTGKIGVKHHLNQDFYVSSNYGTAYNIPTAYNLYAPASLYGPIGNINLTPESTKSFDASVGYKGVVLTYFYNTINDMIDFDMNTYTYNNIKGESTLKGYEAEYKKEVLPKTLLSLNYTHLSAKDKDGKDLARRAKENLKFGIDYYGVEKLHFGIFGEYAGTRYDKLDQKGGQTGRYTVANGVVNYDLTDSIQLYGKIDNIADKYYQTVDGYATSPRAYYAGMEVSF